MSFTLPFSYNKYISTWINNGNTVTGTYKNVSLKVDGDAELNDTTVSKLGVNKNSNPAYEIDVSGNINVSGNFKINGVNLVGVTNLMDASFNNISIVGNTYVNGLTISPTEFGYIDGLTSNAQTQLNSKAGLSTSNTFTGGNTFNFLTISSAGSSYLRVNTNTIRGSANQDILKISGSNAYVGGYNAQNTFAGSGANNNSAYGVYALSQLETGSRNIGLGYEANFVSNTDDCVGIGYRSLYNGGALSSAANCNVACGNETLYNLGTLGTTFYNNTTHGHKSLFSLRQGYNNAALGYNAGCVYVSGVPSLTQTTDGIITNCLFLGYNSGLNDAVSNFNNSIVIGSAPIEASNKIYIGDSNQETIFNGNMFLKNGKTFTNAGTLLLTGNISANSNLIYPAEIGYLSGLSSNAQTQLSNRFTLTGTNTVSSTNTFSNTNTFNGSTIFSGAVTANNLTINSGNYLQVNSNIIKSNTGEELIRGNLNSCVFVGGGGQSSTNIDNTSCGYYALGNLTSGRANIGLGGGANGVTTGNYNIGIGDSSLILFSQGDYNIAIGSESLLNLGLSAGSFSKNIFIGGLSGRNFFGGSNNIGIGYNSGCFFQGGIPTQQNYNGNSDNIFIGNNTGVTSTNYTNSIVIGNTQPITASNTIFVGSSSQETIFNGNFTLKSGNAFILQGNISANSLTISPVELSTLDGCVANIQTQLNLKVDTNSTQTIVGNKTFSGTTTFTGNISANSLTISPVELSYIDGVSSNIQTQLDNKLDNSFSSVAAILSAANAFTEVNSFNNTSSGGSANFYNPPYISNTGFTFLSTSLITKAYGDSTYLTSSTGASLSANQTFTGTNTFSNTVTIGSALTTFYVNALNTDFANNCQFTNQVPKCSVSPSVSNDLVNKNYVDTYFSNLNTANTFTATQTFSVIPKTLASPSASTDLIPKAYGDTNYSNATLLSSSNTFTNTNTFTQIATFSNSSSTGSAVFAIAPRLSAPITNPIDNEQLITLGFANNNYVSSLVYNSGGSPAKLSDANTFTGSTNYFNGNNFEANCVVNTGHIYLKYNGVNMIEIERYALYAPLSISPDFQQITFNYAPVFRTSFYLDNNITQYVGSVYSPANLEIFDGSLTVSSTNGVFKTNTAEPTDINTAITLYATTESSITIGNSSLSNDIIMNGNIKQNNYYRFKTNPTFITSATTLSAPFYKINKFAMTTAAAFTITLPEVNANNLDYELTFKRMGGSLQALTLAPTNTQPIFNDGNSRGQITSFSITTSQNLATLISAQMSPSFSGTFTVTAQPTNIINITAITGSNAYVTVGQKINFGAGLQRIIQGYGTGNGGTGTYTVSVNFTQNYTNQAFTADANFGWLLTENN